MKPFASALANFDKPTIKTHDAFGRGAIAHAQICVKFIIVIFFQLYEMRCGSGNETHVVGGKLVIGTRVILLALPRIQNFC